MSKHLVSIRIVALSVAAIFLLVACKAKHAKGRDEYPLQRAIAEGHTEEAIKLIEAGADVNKKDNLQITPLEKAAEAGNTEIIKRLIAAGANVNVRQYAGETPLFSAAEYGKKAAVDELIKDGADVNQGDYLGATPLHAAVSNSEASVARDLIAHGAKVNARDGFGQTPLHIAAREDQIEEMKILIEAKADLNAARQGLLETPLLLAAFHGRPGAVELLIKSGAKVDALDAIGRNVAHYAALRDHADIIEILARLNINLTLPDQFGATPLHVAAEAGQNKAIAALVARGVPVDPMDFQHDTPLIFATRMKLVDTVKLLVKHGATPTLKNLKGESALSIAQGFGKKKLIAALSPELSMPWYKRVLKYFGI